MDNNTKNDKGFDTDGYDQEAILPNLSNWSRQSKYNGPIKPVLKWVKEFKDAHSKSPIIVDRNGSALFTYNHGKKIRYTKTYGILANVTYQGDLNWQYESSENECLLYTNGLTIGYDGTIFFGTTGGFNKCSHKLLAIDSKGKSIWDYEVGFHIMYSPSISSNGTILFVTEEPSIYALDYNGRFIWKYRNDSKGSFCNTPVISKNKFIYTMCNNGYLHILDLNGNLLKLIDINFSELFDTPYIDLSGNIYLPPDVTAFYPDLTTKWVYKPQKGFISRNLISMSNNNLYCYANYFRMLSIGQNGNLNWEYNMKGSGISFPPIISKEGHVYACSVYDPKGERNSYIQAITENGNSIWELRIEDERIISLALGNSKNIFALTISLEKSLCKLYCFSES